MKEMNNETKHIMKNLTTTTTTRFETSEVYKMGWVTDSEMFNHFIVLKRTEKMITIQEFGMPDSKEIRLKVNVYRDVESVKPFGTYSMAPILKADKFSNIVDTIKTN